jgi:hypothetical protein
MSSLDNPSPSRSGGLFRLERINDGFAAVILGKVSQGIVAFD